MKRKLTDKERDMTIRGIAKQKESLEFLTWDREVISRDIEKGLELKYRSERIVNEARLKELDAKIEDAKFAIKNAEDQLANGVEVKEKKNG